ncbi:MAG: sugar phosphate isomerase/epimerase [Candidatus Bathyarchaeia archaeon]
MEIGLSMIHCLNRPFSYLLRRLEKVDVECVELVDEGLHSLTNRRIDALKKIVQSRDFQLTIHGPFADINIASTVASIRRVMLKRLKKSIKLSSQLNPKLWIFHSGLENDMSDICPGLSWRTNLKSVYELLKTANQYGVKITIENGPDPFPFLLKTANDLIRFYDDLGEADLDLTLDVGHANINGQIYELLSGFPDKIVHAHLHDNLGRFDEHLGIGQGNINWLNLIRKFKETNYKGTLIIESNKDIEESLKTLKTILEKV